MPKKIDVDVLLGAAVTVFAEYGYKAATVQVIARRAGVNEVTLFRRYGGKGALISAALGHVLAQSPFARLTVSEDVTADLIGLVRAYAQTVQAYGGAVITLLTEIPRYPELHDAMGTVMPNLANAAGVIAIHQSRGTLAPGDPMQKLVMLIAPILAAGMWARTGAIAITAELDPETIVAVFLDGHRAA